MTLNTNLLRPRTALLPKLDGNRLPTNTTTWKHAVHRWYNFIAGYSPEFVQSCIANDGLSEGAIALDPFAGCGTTMVVANSLGLDAVGYEPHPIFYRISMAKTQLQHNFERVDGIYLTLLSGFDRAITGNELSDDAWTFLGKLFEPAILKNLIGARRALEASAFSEDVLAFLILSRLIDECSFAQTDGIYKAPSSRKKAHPPREALERIILEITQDIPSEGGRSAHSVVHPSSSEMMTTLADNSIDIVITSPPYLNNFDYAEMTRMHLYFWNMAGNWGEITDRVRSKLVVNTTTALKGHKGNQEKYRQTISPNILSEIDRIVEQLSSIKLVKAGKKDYDFLILPYMAQMTRIYSECFRVLKPGSTAHIVVADAAFYGTHIPSPQWMVEACKSIGFSLVDISMMRKRGHRWVLDKRAGSPTGLGEYYIRATK